MVCSYDNHINSKVIDINYNRFLVHTYISQLIEIKIIEFSTNFTQVNFFYSLKSDSEVTGFKKCIIY